MDKRVMNFKRLLLLCFIFFLSTPVLAIPSYSCSVGEDPQWYFNANKQGPLSLLPNPNPLVRTDCDTFLECGSLHFEFNRDPKEYNLTGYDHSWTADSYEDKGGYVGYTLYDHVVDDGTPPFRTDTVFTYASSVTPEYECKLFDYFLVPSAQPSNDTESCPLEKSKTNPCNPSTGNKIQKEVDYVPSGSNDLSLSRYYNSQNENFPMNSFSDNWQHSFSASMNTVPQLLELSTEAAGPYTDSNLACINGFNEMKDKVWSGSLVSASAEFTNGLCNIKSASGATIASFSLVKVPRGELLPSISPPEGENQIISRPDGSFYVFKQGNGFWFDINNLNVKLKQEGTNWIFTDNNNIRETYNQNGQLITITQVNERQTSLNYTVTSDVGGDDNDSTLDTVTDADGSQLIFNYNGVGGATRLSSITTPDGDISYSYNTANLSEVTYADNSQKTYEYADTRFPNHLTAIGDENGQKYASWTYHADGKAASSEHGSGQERATLTYNSDFSTSVNGALNDNTIYHFEYIRGIRRVTSITGDQCRICGNGFMQTRTYDDNGYLNGYTDWQGNQTTITNNSRGLPTQQTDAVGTPEARTTYTTWHNSLNLPLTVTEPKRQTTLTYTSTGELLTRTVTDPATGISRTVTYTYHPLGTNGGGLIATIDGPRTDVNDVTSYAYNNTDDLISTTNALGHVTQITSHDASGRPLTVIDANNITTTLVWDLRGRLLSTNVAGSITTFEYDPVGQLIKATQADGSYLSYTYDDAHRLTDITDNDANKITYVLDKMGNRTSTSIADTAGNISYSQTAIFDKLSRLQQSLGANSQSQTLNYDDNHNPLDSTDALSRKSKSNYDALDRLIKSIDPDAEETNFNYDNQDNLTKVTDAKGLETTYTYNGFDEVISQTSPDTGTTSYTYDNASNRTSMTDARGITVDYTYDALNRLTNVDYADNTLDVTHSYDIGTHGIGRLRSTNDGSGDTSYSYDSRGNLLTKTVTTASISQTTSYTYNDANRLSSMTYPSGNALQYQRAENGEITGITATIDGVTQTLLSNADYKPFGPLETYTYGNGLTHTSTFDSSLRLTAQNTSTVQVNSYAYNAVNNMVSFTNSLDDSLDQSFTYNALDRLSDASGEYGDYQYVFDVVGNRTQKIDSSNTNTIEDYVYGTNDHHLQNTTGTNTSNYQYDANGNTTDNGNYQFVYGQDNRLHQATQNGTTVGNYTYNALGQRTRKVTSSNTTNFYYDQGGRLIAESDGSGQIQRETVWFNGSPYALMVKSSGTNITPEPIGTPYLSSVSEGATIASGEHTFTWNTNGANADFYWLDIGSTTGADDIFSLQLPATTNSHTVTGLPTDGSPLYVTLYYSNAFDNVTRNIFASTTPAAGTPYLTSIAEGGVLTGADHTFTWEPNGASADFYWLDIGSAIDTTDDLSSTLLPATTTSHTVTGLPTDGSPLYLSLYYTSSYDKVTRSILASTTPAAGTPYITSISAGASLTGSEHNFTWNPNGTSADYYWLDIGSTSGADDLSSTLLPATAVNHTVTGLPTDGRPLYVSLYYTNGYAKVTYDIFASDGTGTENSNSTDVYYVHNNHQGTPETISDQSQSIVWKANYTPYGEATVTSNIISNNVRLPGQYFDSETGLHYNYFRYYDPKLGRYVTSDPIGLGGGINTYGYVGGNPVGKVDPLGLYDQLKDGSGNYIDFDGANARTHDAMISDAYSQVGGAIAEHGWMNPGILIGTGFYGSIGSLGAKGLYAGLKGCFSKTAYRAVSDLELKDIKKFGFRQKPNGRSMEDKWFSESKIGAQKFRDLYPEQNNIVKAKVPNSVYNNSYKHPNIDRTGPGFAVPNKDLSKIKLKK